MQNSYSITINCLAFERINCFFDRLDGPLRAAFSFHTHYNFRSQFVELDKLQCPHQLMAAVSVC